MIEPIQNSRLINIKLLTQILNSNISKGQFGTMAQETNMARISIQTRVVLVVRSTVL